MRCRLTKVLVAARGVVAVRIIRACRDLGIGTVACYDDPDVWALHAVLADEAYVIPESGGYGDAASLFAVARRCGADAVHPGDGPLAEDAAAAAQARSHGLGWIGASPELLSRRSPVLRAGPGTAQQAQVDVLAGMAGVVPLGARISAVSRRGIPVVSLTAPPDVTAELLPQASAMAAEAGLTGYGAVTFERRRSGGWQVTGLSARLTAEHAVTEEQAGVDIVRAQLDLALDPAARLPQPARRGAAIGFAVEAEDRARGCLRAGGTVRSFQLPEGPGVRVDSALNEGLTIWPTRDNRLAFVTVSAGTRQQARDRLTRAAGELSVLGVTAATWVSDQPGRPDPAFTDAAPEAGIVPLDVRGGGTMRLAVR